MNVSDQLQELQLYFYKTDSNGFITHSYSVDGLTGIELLKQEPELRSGYARSDTHYEVDGVLSLRPEQLTVLSGFTLRNLPEPCQVIINGIPYEVNTKTLELEFDEPGTYSIKIVAFPYLDKEFTIEA